MGGRAIAQPPLRAQIPTPYKDSTDPGLVNSTRAANSQHKHAGEVGRQEGGKGEGAWTGDGGHGEHGTCDMYRPEALLQVM